MLNAFDTCSSACITCMDTKHISGREHKKGTFCKYSVSAIFLQSMPLALVIMFAQPSLKHVANHFCYRFFYSVKHIANHFCYRCFSMLQYPKSSLIFPSNLLFVTALCRFHNLPIEWFSIWPTETPKITYSLSPWHWLATEEEKKNVRTSHSNTAMLPLWSRLLILVLPLFSLPVLSADMGSHLWIFYLCHNEFLERVDVVVLSCLCWWVP